LGVLRGIALLHLSEMLGKGFHVHDLPGERESEESEESCAICEASKGETDRHTHPRPISFPFSQTDPGSRVCVMNGSVPPTLVGVT
jgi:hypothetical protein